MVNPVISERSLRTELISAAVGRLDYCATAVAAAATATSHLKDLKNLAIVSDTRPSNGPTRLVTPWRATIEFDLTTERSLTLG
jgi:hypothetical protein